MLDAEFQHIRKAVRLGRLTPREAAAITGAWDRARRWRRPWCWATSKHVPVPLPGPWMVRSAPAGWPRFCGRCGLFLTPRSKILMERM